LLKEPDARKAVDLDAIKVALKMSDLGRGLSEESLAGLSQEVEYRTLNKGDFAFQQGEPVRCCCILLGGRVIMKAESTSGAVEAIGEVDEGQNFGGEWMLMAEKGTNKNSLAHQSYIADKPCQLLVILKEHFVKYCMGESSKNLKKKVRRSEERSDSRCNAYCMCYITKHLSARRFVHRRVSSLPTLGSSTSGSPRSSSTLRASAS